ncbi:hypothetical protein C8Q72DRAFT_330875 [Fomitopsis betulina]|nr:hypothetical protein C8Q72DRAFT_330875 [Fomitopsis betulina]
MLIFEHLRLAAVAPFLLLPLLPVTASPLSSCYGNSTTLDWYIDAVGETPCMTYQKLRQICNSNYQTPSWAIDATTDQCDDPLNICCCNSISWSIRMLCINCQWDEFGTSDPGHSAGAGDFYTYRWSSGVVNEGNYCGDGWNQTLPESVQLAVCQKGIRLENFLYSIFWPDGSWNFPDFEQQAQQILVSQPQSLSYCANTTQNATTTLNSASPTNTQSVPPAAVTSVAKTNTTAAVGGALGGALALVLIGAIVVAILVYRRRMRRLRVLLDDSQDLSQNKQEGIPPSIVTPFLGQYPGGSQVRLEHTPKGTSGMQPRAPSGLYSPPSVTGYGEEGYGIPAPVSIVPSTYHMSSSELVRERDAGRVQISHPQLPPDYRTVYSVS